MSFNAASTPNSNLYSGAASGVSVSGVSASATIMTATATSGYTVTATATPGGTISPSSRLVSVGATTTFTVTPNAGFAIASVTDNCGAGGALVANTYTTPAINAACTVSATFDSAPTGVTGAVGGISAAGGAVLNGLVNPNGASTTVSFEYGTTMAYGTTVVIAGAITGYTTQIISSSALAGLACGTTYHYRVTATNIRGTLTGTDATFVACVSKTAGDFNGDGKSDILIRNATSGQVSMWLMNGAAVSSSATLPNLGAYTATTGWQIQGVGDFNADGKSDLLLRNAGSGQMAVWLMNGAAITSGTYLPTLGAYTATTGWQIIRTQ